MTLTIDLSGGKIGQSFGGPCASDLESVLTSVSEAGRRSHLFCC